MAPLMAVQRLLLLLLAAAGATLSSAAELQRCHTGGARVGHVAGSRDGWPRIFVNVTQENCPGIDLTRSLEGEGGDQWAPLEMRAVYYVPRPIGMPPGATDLYTRRFLNIHRRDLQIIADVLKANTLRLEPWDDTKDHTDFLNLCREFGLFVIPAFGLREFFINPSLAELPYLQRETVVVKELDRFLNHIDKVKDNTIIGWTVDYSLMLNETVTNGRMSRKEFNSKRRTYFSMIRALRTVQHAHERRPQPDPDDPNQPQYLPLPHFKYPLLLPLDLSSRGSLDEIFWFTSFVEAEWCAWPKEGAWEPEEMQSLKRFGCFDGWLAMAMPETSPDGEQSIVQAMARLFNRTGTNSSGTAEDFISCLNEPPKVGGDCDYRLSKPLVLQYGFGVLQQDPSKLLTLKMDLGRQQAALLRIWQQVHSRSPAFAGVSGAVIDEWVDDWGRCQTAGYNARSYNQNRGGACDEVRPGELIHMEWFGLAGQYSYFGMHCIDPRFSTNHPMNPDTESPECIDGTDLSKCKVFRFELTDANDFNNLCRFIMPEIWIKIWLLLSIILVLMAWCFRAKKMCCSGEAAANDPETSELEALSDTSFNPTTTSTTTSDSAAPGADGVPRQWAKSIKIANKTYAHSIPEVFGKGRKLNLVLETTNPTRQSNSRFTPEKALMHLTAHVKAQHRRLWYQVESEALALQSQGYGKGGQEACYHQAMVNVHARVLEGYAAWLQSTVRPTRGSSMRQWLDALLDNQSGGEGQALPKWQLFAEALLLRVVESLAEQALHAPEFLANYYNSIRDWESQGMLLQEDPTFVINYDDLRVGLEMLRKNANPYKGGINFDDMNDRGYIGRIDVDAFEKGKTYHESTSVFVIVDLLSNFQGILFIKLWVFMLAFYISLGKDERNGSLLQPTYRRVAAIKISLAADCVLAVLIESIIILHDIAQRRQLRCLFLIRRLFSLAAALVGLGVFYLNRELPDLSWDRTVSEFVDPPRPAEVASVIMCAGMLGVRIVVFCISVTPRRSIPYLPGRPWGRKGQENAEVSSQPLTASTPLLLPRGVGSVLGTVRGSLSRAGSSRPSGSAPTDGTEQVELGEVGRSAPPPQPVANDSSARYTGVANLAFWPFMLGCCFLLEVFFIVPLISSFSWDQFCGDNCVSRQGKIFGKIPGYGSDCLACSATLVLICLLVLLTAFFDIYFLFYGGTAVVGYVMGEQRGLRNVLSTALRQLDLTLGDAHSRQVHSTGAWLSRTVTNAARAQQQAQLSDGEAMRRVFGSSWRMVWSRIVESLYDDCQISSEDADQMTRAAGAVRWTRHVEKSAEFTGPRDAFRRLRFVMEATRGGGNPETAAEARNRCISQLKVMLSRSGDSETFDITEPSKVRYELLNAGHRPTVLKAMDASCVLLQDLGNEATRGMRLVAVNGFQSSNGAELRDALEQEEDFPAVLVFARPGVKYGEVTVDLKRSCRVYAVSFTTSSDKDEFDPVKWRVEGQLDGSVEVWKQLVWQDTVYAPPLARRIPVGVTFDVEFWRQKNVSAPGTVDFRSLLPIVQERLGFFTASLRGLLREKDKYAIRFGVDTLLDSHLGNVPSLSQIIPVYSETVILSEKMLRAVDGVNTNLGFIISQYPEEWALFAKRLKTSTGELYHGFMEATIDAKEIMEVRLWASMRSQTVARTVVGALLYHEVISMLPTVQNHDDPDKAVESCVELILAHQTFGTGAKENDEDVKYLLQAFPKRPFYLVFDYDSSRSRLAKQVNWFMKQHYPEYQGTIQYASVLARFRQRPLPEGSRDEGQDPVVEIVEVLPRYYPLLIGEGDFRTQGKSGNQLGALRFARGHYLQMMDANMGAFMGEACKVPFVLRRFQPHGTDRAVVEARIIGFREFIFTEQHGLVGNIMASAEWSFGTICQRFLAGLGARMHYGHPDFLDAFWASNRGSLSKASPAINLSEDIFAGFNVAMRGERSKHVDFLAWEKGREASFNAATLFYRKISQGNAGVMRSRDLKIITESLGIWRNFSFYFASVGFYFNNLMIDFSLVLYVRIFIFLTLASKSLHEVGVLDSMLAAEWVLSLGVIAMIPRFMELTLEYGPLEGILRFVPTMPACMAMFTFINKSISAGLADTIMTGEASYIATGRPNANTHYSWRECYFVHCETHYYPAIKILVCYLLYTVMSQAQGVSSLPMIVVLITTGMWIVAPVLFCPQPTLATVATDLSEFWQFIIATPERSVRRLLTTRVPQSTESALRSSFGDMRSTLYEFWLSRELQHKKASKRQRLGNIFIYFLEVVAVVAVVYSSMLDQFWTIVLLFSMHFTLMELWRFFNRPMVMQLLTTFMWIVIPAFTEIPITNVLVIIICVLYGLRAFRHLVLLAAWIWLRPNIEWSKMKEENVADQRAKRAAAHKVIRYDMVVEYLYVNLLSHQLHLYCAIFILLANLATQVVLVAVDHVYGFHSWVLLNARLRSPSCCARRVGFAPGREHED